MALFENVVVRTKVVGKKTKLKTDLLFLDRAIQARKKKFGVTVYDRLSAITCQQDFYATTDKTIATIRPQLLEADREIRALDGKKLQRKGDLDLAEAVRREAFPTQATDFKEKTANLGKNISMTANEAKIKLRLSAINTETHLFKEALGLKLYPIVEELFGPSVQPIAVHCSTDESVNKLIETYNDCREDIVKFEREKSDKLGLIDKLDIDVSLMMVK